MPIRWYGPADPTDPTYRHFERIVNLCLHAGVFAAVNSGAWFAQEMRQPFPVGRLPLITGIWFTVLLVQFVAVVILRPGPAEPTD